MLPSTTTLWLRDASEADAIKAQKIGFKKVVSITAGEALPTEVGNHLLVDARNASVEQLPLDHLLKYAADQEAPVIGVHLNEQPTQGEPKWQMNAELRLEEMGEQGACQAALTPAGVVAGHGTPEDLRQWLTNPRGAARGYPLAKPAAGNEKSRKAVFLDRDGVINVDTGYGHRPEDFAFVPGVVEFLRRLQADDWQLVILTNQAGVAKGKFPMQVAEDYHRYITDQLAAEGITILASELCPYHADGSVAAYRAASIFRKPQPGMALKLASAHSLALDQSIMIGDKDSDRLRLPGLTPYIIKGRYPLKLPHYHSFADILAALAEAGLQ